MKYSYLIKNKKSLCVVLMNVLLSSSVVAGEEAATVDDMTSGRVVASTLFDGALRDQFRTKESQGLASQAHQAHQTTLAFCESNAQRARTIKAEADKTSPLLNATHAGVLGAGLTVGAGRLLSVNQDDLWKVMLVGGGVGFYIAYRYEQSKKTNNVLVAAALSDHSSGLAALADQQRATFELVHNVGQRVNGLPVVVESIVNEGNARIFRRVNMRMENLDTRADARAAETVAAIRAEREFQVGNVAALPEARGYAAMTTQASARQRDAGLHAAASTRLMQSVQQRGGVLSTEVAPPSLLSRAFSWEGGGRFVATASVLGLLGYSLTKK